MSLENRFAGLGIGNGVNFSQAEKQKIVDGLVEVGITASMADTYDTLKTKILAAEQTGVSILPSASNQAIPNGVYDTGGGVVQGDADLISANIKAGKNIFGVAGNTNVVDTSLGDATANQILNNYKAYVDGSLVTGNIPSKTAQTYTPTTSNQTISSGQYLSGTQIIEGDADLIAGNIKNGVNIFGVAGNFKTLLSNTLTVLNPAYTEPYASSTRIISFDCGLDTPDYLSIAVRDRVDNYYRFLMIWNKLLDNQHKYDQVIYSDVATSIDTVFLNFDSRVLLEGYQSASSTKTGITSISGSTVTLQIYLNRDVDLIVKAYKLG